MFKSLIFGLKKFKYIEIYRIHKKNLKIVYIIVSS